MPTFGGSISDSPSEYDDDDESEDEEVQQPAHQPTIPLSLEKCDDSSAASGYHLHTTLEREYQSVLGFRILEETVKSSPPVQANTPCSDLGCSCREKVEELERLLEKAVAERDEMRTVFEAFQKVITK